MTQYETTVQVPVPVYVLFYCLNCCAYVLKKETMYVTGKAVGVFNSQKYKEARHEKARVNAEASVEPGIINYIKHINEENLFYKGIGACCPVCGKKAPWDMLEDYGTFFSILVLLILHIAGFYNGYHLWVTIVSALLIVYKIHKIKVKNKRNLYLLDIIENMPSEALPIIFATKPEQEEAVEARKNIGLSRQKNGLTQNRLYYTKQCENAVIKLILADMIICGIAAMFLVS